MESLYCVICFSTKVTVISSLFNISNKNIMIHCITCLFYLQSLIEICGIIDCLCLTIFAASQGTYSYCDSNHQQLCIVQGHIFSSWRYSLSARRRRWYLLCSDTWFIDGPVLWKECRHYLVITHHSEVRFLISLTSWDYNNIL